MFKYRMRFTILAAVLALSGLSAVSAKTETTAEHLYLERGKDWVPISAESKKAFEEADSLVRKRKFAKAVRGYDKFLDACDPNSELYVMALDRQFDIAKEYLRGRKRTVLAVFKIKGYATGIRVMERISRRAREAIIVLSPAAEAAESNEKRVEFEGVRKHLETISMHADVEIAKSYEERGKLDKEYYGLAYLKWLEISDIHDQIRKDALLAMARCQRAAYKGPKYDDSVLTGRGFTGESQYSAGGIQYRGVRYCYEELGSFEGAKKFGIESRLKEINGQMAYKDLIAGRYYQKTGNRQAANLYYEMVIRDWYQAFELRYPQSVREFTVGKILKQISTPGAYQKTGSEHVDDFVLDNWPQSKVAKMAYEMLSRNLGGAEIKNEQRKP